MPKQTRAEELAAIERFIAEHGIKRLPEFTEQDSKRKKTGKRKAEKKPNSPVLNHSRKGNR